ncbi:MAG: ParB/RepB/Spo0J family partition protein [Planctomycetota bacterium]|nr:MAG: ParB/RepB/Spo0J family partition protein [Planctomycetota bacterium]
MSDQFTQEAPRRRLGRGLSAMLGTGPAYNESTPADAELRNIPIADLTRNPFQPRKDFHQEDLNELADSVREHGILQPLLVREYEGTYQLIAGERRWLAAQRAGLTVVPCRVVDVVDQTAFEYALEENLKRKDLSDIEKAFAFREYLSHFSCSIEDLGKQLSMSRSAVSNMLRLLDLPVPVRNAISSGKISSGHARSLLPLPEADQLAMCGRIQAEGLSVRQTEATVRQMLGRSPSEPPAASAVETTTSAPAAMGAPESIQQTEAVPAPAEPIGTGEAPNILSIEQARSETERTPHLESLEEQLRNLLGLPVEIKLKSKDSGTILIPFTSNDEFEQILRSLRRAVA